MSTTGPSACNHERVVRRGPRDSASLRNGPHSVPTFPLASDIRLADALDELTDSFDRSSAEVSSGATAASFSGLFGTREK